MTLFNFILWDVSPDIFSIGSLTIRWYGLFFAMAFLIGQQIMLKIYQTEGKSEKDVESLTVYMVVATIIGARLGHCLFYEPEFYLSNPIEILKIWEGGLASHGAAFGILIAIYLYSRKHSNQSFLYIVDRMVLVVALAGCFIRFGNLMNSEIIGRPTNISTAFIFLGNTESTIEESHPYIEDLQASLSHKDSVSPHGQILAGVNLSFNLPNQDLTEKRVSEFVQMGLRKTIVNAPDYYENVILPDGPMTMSYTPGHSSTNVTAHVFGIPRHPAQVYEAISTLLLFFFLLFMYMQKKGATPDGRLFGYFIVILFTLRFFYEFLKEPQVDFEKDIPLYMGQILSIPLVIAGLIILIRSYVKKKG